MAFSIRCPDHQTDSRFRGEVWELFEDAQAAAERQTASHRAAGLDCTFEVVSMADLPRLDPEHYVYLLSRGATPGEPGVDFIPVESL